MATFSIREAKTHLSRLIEQAASGEQVIIAKAGKPLVKVTTIDAPARPRRLGCMAGEFTVPGDFDRMGGDAIEKLFTGGA